MAARHTRSDLYYPEEEMEPITVSFPPQRSTKAIVVTLISTAFGGALAGVGLAWLFAPGSAVAQFVGFMMLPLVLGFGFKLWEARVVSYLTKRFGWGLVKFLWQALVHRRRPDAAGLLPTREDAEELARRMLRGMSAFTHMGAAVGAVAAPIAGLASSRFLVTTVIFFVAAVSFGRLCTRLARGGYLQPPGGEL
jgi:hypothetical protein